jgi:hypothetical protein
LKCPTDIFLSRRETKQCFGVPAAAQFRHENRKVASEIFFLAPTCRRSPLDFTKSIEKPRAKSPTAVAPPCRANWHLLRRTSNLQLLRLFPSSSKNPFIRGSHALHDIQPKLCHGTLSRQRFASTNLFPNVHSETDVGIGFTSISTTAKAELLPHASHPSLAAATAI